GEDVIYGYTNDLTDAALGELVASLAGLRGDTAGRPDSAGRGGVDLRKLDGGPNIHAPTVPFEKHDKLWRLERLRELDAGARISPHIKQVEGTLLEWEQDVWIANSEGAYVEDRRVRTRLVAQAIASDGAETQTGHAGPGLSMGL